MLNYSINNSEKDRKRKRESQKNKRREIWTTYGLDMQMKRRISVCFVIPGTCRCGRSAQVDWEGDLKVGRLDSTPVDLAPSFSLLPLLWRNRPPSQSTCKSTSQSNSFPALPPPLENEPTKKKENDLINDEINEIKMIENILITEIRMT